MATYRLPDQNTGMALAGNSYPDPIFELPRNWVRMDLGEAALPTGKFESGWNLQQNASGTIENSFEVIVNKNTQQIVLSFKGSVALSNWTSDVLNNGSSGFFKIQKKAQAGRMRKFVGCQGRRNRGLPSPTRSGRISRKQTSDVIS